MKQSGAFTPGIEFLGRGTVPNPAPVINGSGTVTAAQPNYGPGLITWWGLICVNSLEIGPDVRLKGSIEFEGSAFYFDGGTVRVDHVDDTMKFADYDCINGTGTVIVKAGTLVFDSLDEAGNLDANLDFEVAGGTIQCKSGAFETSGTVTVEGTGKLDLDQDFTATGGLAFSGGSIEVAAGKTAAFSNP